MGPRDELAAAVDTGIVAAAVAAERVKRWAPRTCIEYLKQVEMARKWWEVERRQARRRAEGAGLTGVPPADAAAFMPWPPDRLVRYVQYLAEQGAAIATIRKAPVAIKAWHRLHGLPVPDGLPCADALQVLDASLTAAGRGTKHAEPITAETLAALLTACDRDVRTLRRVHDAAVICATVAAMASAAAMARMRRRDVEPTAGGMRLRKPDGPWIEVAHWDLGGGHRDELCPVECVLAWCGYLDSRSAGPGSPLWRAIDQHQNVAGFDRLAGGTTDPDGWPDERLFGELVRRVAKGAGIDPPPMMTVLRISGIVQRRAGGAGVDQLAGESGIATLLRYVRLAENLNPTAPLDSPGNP